MKKVIYSEYVKGTNGPLETLFLELQEKGEAEFLDFGIDYEQYDTSCGMFSTAIIKLEDGTVKNIPVEHIRFI